MAEIKLVATEEGYFLRCGEEESDVVEFGEPVTLKTRGKEYLGYCDVDGGEYTSVLDSFVYEVRGMPDVEPEDEGEEEVVEEVESTEDGGDDDDGEEAAVVEEESEAEAA